MEGLGISLPTFIAQVVNFVILLVILSFFVYKPIMKMLDERPRKIKESLDEGEKVRAEAVKAEEDFKKRLEAAGKESQEVIAKAIRTGEEARQRAQVEAKEEAKALVEKARQDIQHERDEVIGELRQEFTDLTIVAAEKVIEKSLDRKAHQEIIEKVLEDSTTLKPKG
jgi:F-type H+-transporting ATPase subunit b